MTIKEFFKNADTEKVSLNGTPFYTREFVERALLIFAKYHVEQVLIEAYNKAEVNVGYCVERESVINAYLLENIK